MILIRIVFSIVGLFAGFGAFITFLVMQNIQASIWALMTGHLSMSLLRIHWLQYTTKIVDVYTPQSLIHISWLGFFHFVIGTMGFIYNLVLYLYLQTPILPVESSLVIVMVWCILTLKSGFLLYWYARKYSQFVAEHPIRVPLINEDIRQQDA